MNRGGGKIILAGKAIYASLEALVWRSVFEAEGAELLPARVESRAEAEELFGALGLEGIYLNRVGEGASASAGQVADLAREARAEYERLRGRPPRAEFQRVSASAEAAAARRASMPERGRALALVGLTAAGKTATARILAGLSGLPFVDLDELIEAAAGLRVAEIFAAEGERGFRRREEEALAKLAAAGPSVLACGGGVVLSAANRSLLAGSFTTVWLHVEPETALARLARDPGSLGRRPLLARGNAVELLGRLLAERLPLYATCADLLLSTENRHPGEVAELVHAELVHAEIGSSR